MYNGTLNDLDALAESELEVVFGDDENPEHVRLYAIACYMRHIPGGHGYAIDNLASLAVLARDRERAAMGPKGPSNG